MATFILCSRLTDEGRRTLKARPERLHEVNTELEAMGGKVTAQFAVLGRYDFVSFVGAASNEAIARISVELGSRGTLQVTTFPAIDIASLVETLRGAVTGGPQP